MENSTFVSFLSLQQLAAAKNLRTASLMERAATKITADKPSRVYVSAVTKADEQLYIPCHRSIGPEHKLADLRFGIDHNGEVCALLSKALDTETFD